MNRVSVSKIICLKIEIRDRQLGTEIDWKFNSLLVIRNRGQSLSRVNNRDLPRAAHERLLVCSSSGWDRINEFYYVIISYSQLPWRLYRWSVCETWSMLGFRKVVSNSSLLFSNSHTNLSRFLRYRNSSSSLIKFFLTCAWILLMGTCNLIPLSLLCGTQHYVIQD